MSDVPDFTGDLDGYLRWRAEHPEPFNPYWCAAHWAPCPVEGRFGMVAAVLMAGEAFAFVPSNVTSPDALNSWFANQTVPVCCKLGDEKVAFLWELMRKLEEGELCEDATGVSGGRHVCFYDKGHDGPHEQESPAKSIFAGESA